MCLRMNRKRPASRAAGIALVALLAAGGDGARAETWSYRVELDPAAPLTARVSVELPAARRAQDFSVQVRGMGIELVPQVADLRCDGAPLAPDSAGAWRVQGWNCVRLSWQVPMKTAAAGVDPRSRESVFDPAARYWLFSEAASLLRPVGEAQHRGEVEFVGGGPVYGGALVAGSARRSVPELERAPEFYVVGDLPAVALREAGAEVLHVDAAGVKLAPLLDEQRRALRYFVRTGGLHRSAAAMTVVWLAGGEDSAAPVQVDGDHTVLLGGAAFDGRLRHVETHLVGLLRQSFAQLLPAGMPAWARESLAQFYALKALRRSDLPPAAVAAAERRYIDALRPPALKLREAQRRLQAGEAAARADLQVNGATFWDRVERAIVRKSGFRTLDSILPRLVAVRWPDDRLPPAVVERLRRYGGDSAIDGLIEHYVGD
jgi:hypothetical protein